MDALDRKTNIMTAQAWAATAVAATGWALLVGGELKSWVIGVPTALFAGWIYGRLADKPLRRRPLAACRFAAWFVLESFKAGIDVARRALSPSMPLTPGLITYRTQLPPGEPRLLLGGTISLIPGTLLVSLHEARLVVHVVDTEADNLTSLRELERRIAPIYASSEEGRR